MNLHNWSKGSFAGFSLGDCAVSGAIIFLTVLCVCLLAKPIGAYQLGETYARTMGVNTRLFRPILILLSSVLSACVTAFAGPVSFVGIAVPFLIKQLVQTAKPLVVIPGAFFGEYMRIFPDVMAAVQFMGMFAAWLIFCRYGRCAESLQHS